MQDPPTIYFLRHGETDWNRDRRYQGQKDIPLNETGRAQAHRNGVALRTYLPSIAQAEFVSSPLSRARDTMEIVRRELGLDPATYAVDPRLVELSYGAWEGTLQDEIAKRFPAERAERAQDPYRWRPLNGESYADLFERVGAWAASITRDSVVVSHGGVSRCLRAHALALDPATIPDLESPQDRVLIVSGNTMRWL
jgi:probable phosphoglycerate mutase